MRRSKKTVAKCLIFWIVFMILANMLFLGLFLTGNTAQNSLKLHTRVKIKHNGTTGPRELEEEAIHLWRKKLRSTTLSPVFERAETGATTRRLIRIEEKTSKTTYASMTDSIRIHKTQKERNLNRFTSKSFGESDKTKVAKTRAFLVVGVPTVRRPKAANYLSQTLRELVEGLDEPEKREVLIVVLITDFHSSDIQSVQKEINDSFANEINSGLLRVVTAPRSFYPSLDNLPKLWGDSPERVRWRSKQCLDYAFLFNYSKNLSDYYIQIEDDISTAKGYLKTIKNFVTTNHKREWSVLEFGARGFIGMMYRTSDVSRLSFFVKSYFWAQPIDILYRHFNSFHLYGNPDWARYRPPLFRHVGVFSSLVGQVRALEDINTTHRIYKDSHNPHAEVNTSIVNYDKYASITAVYDTVHHGMFWGKDIKLGDYILVRFYSPARVSRLIVESGGVLAPDDYFGGARISYSNSDGRGKCGTFTVWQEYKDAGQLKAQSNSPKGILCQCLRIEITEVRKDKRGFTRWLAIREIAVWTTSS